MLSDDTLVDFTRRNRRYGAKTAVRCGTQALSYVELDDRVEALAFELRRRGLGAGKVATIYGGVSPEWIIGYHAILRTGAIVNPINALLTADEVAFIVKDCAANLLLADRARLLNLRQADAHFAGLDSIAFENFASYGEKRSNDVEIVPAHAISTICYTSGTTGRPKGARLSHHSVLTNAGLTALMYGRTAEDVFVSALPLAHVYGNVVMNGSLLVGATLVLLPSFTPEVALETIATHRATFFDGVPTMYLRMLDSPALSKFDLSSLRMCSVGGQTMAVERMRAVEEALGCPLVELWGMSEIGGLGMTFPWTGPRVLGSVGVAIPGFSVRTVDPASRVACAADEPGELQIRGPTLMQGYHGNEAATREVLDSEGWLSTGDVARIDREGRVYIVDRIKDVIFTSGNNVYPAEIERVIATLPGVVMVGVGRAAHADKGEVPHAYVVVDRGTRLTAEQVIDHCRASLAPYKLPRHVSFVEDLPKTPSGKILRRQLGASSATKS